MYGIGPDRTQTLEVMGTTAFEQFVKELEVEGVGIKTVNEGPKPSVKIEPVDEKRAFDINIPLTMPRLTHNYRRISDLNLRCSNRSLAGGAKERHCARIFN